MAESSYLRYPHLADDLVTFAAEDDVWLASLSEAAGGRGTQARRLTADRAPLLHPRLNPSATHVAWTSTRDGTRSLSRGAPREAYAVPVDGGPVRRLTYWGDQFTAVRGWVSDDEVLVLSATGQHATMRTWAFAVPLSGPARRLGYGPAGDVAVHDGAVLVGSALNIEQSLWKRYRGGSGGKIWYSPDGKRYTRILADVGDDLVNPMFVGPRVVFLSDHEGTGALYSALPDGTGLRRHTDLGQYYARNATTDGRRVVYQRAGEIWLLESLDAEPVRLDIRLSGDRSGRAPYPVSAKSQLGWFTLDAAGGALAAEVRGTVHWVPAPDRLARDEAARALLAEPGVRGRLPVIIPGKDAVACASDSGGEDGLDVIPADGSAGGSFARRIGHGEFGRIQELAVAPDGRTVAVACTDGRLLTVALEDEQADGEPVVTEIARSPIEWVTGLVFSPDSALLAWAQPWRPDPAGASQIRLARLADGTVTDVTPPRFADSSPAFTLDGKYLAFLSNRAFDPVYDEHVLDLGFLPGVRPYLVTLLATTPSPFAPELNGRPAEPECPAAGLDTGGLDMDGLASRIVPFPVAAGGYGKLRAVTGGVVWLERPRAGELGEAVIGADEPHPARLIRYDLARRTRTVEVGALDDYAVSGDGARLACQIGESLQVRQAGEPDGKPVSVDLDRIRVTVDPAAEWRQMYHETWRLMRDNFWRSDMGGVDWAAAGDRYRPLLDRIGTADDLHDVLRELQGETGTSHTGIRTPGGDGDPALAQGLLGADVERTDDGTWRIARILPAESSVIGACSPLAAPGVAAAPGDLIVAVDGRPVDPDLGPNALLTGKAGQPAELTLRRGGSDRRAVVVPLASEHAVRYYDLVARQRAAVREASGGRLGYLHVSGANPQGWADFHRDQYTEFGRDGLIVDLRETEGGDASWLVAEKLARRVFGWYVSRHEEKPLGYPFEAPRGPIVAITDEFAMSGGDIVVQVLKSRGIATVVGTRTWGGVIGCYFNQLLDGTWVAQPASALWVDGPGWGVENHGADPDVEVAIPPHDWAADRDPQLDTAVRLALQALEQRPPAAPPDQLTRGFHDHRS